MITGIISRRCYTFEYRISCYICDTLKVRYGPSAWARVHKCYDKEVRIPSTLLAQLEFLEIAKNRSLKLKRLKDAELVQKQIDRLIGRFKEDAIKDAKDKWKSSLTIWGDMIKETIEDFLDVAAKKKCASYGGPGTICAKWEIRNLSFTEEIIEINE